MMRYEMYLNKSLPSHYTFIGLGGVIVQLQFLSLTNHNYFGASIVEEGYFL